MDRIVAYSVRRQANPHLVAALEERFSSHKGKYGAFTFILGSEEEAQFREFIERMNIPTLRTEHIRVSRKEIDSIPFFYFSIREDCEYPRPEYMDTSERCGGDETVFCDAGVEQIYKVLVNSLRSKKFDIMLDTMWLKPRIIIISRKLKELLTSVQATGCEYVPCLRPDRDYSEEERSFASPSARLEEEATHFQLVITGKPLRQPYVGEITIRHQCSGCGALYTWETSEGTHFERHDLPAVDFVAYDRIRDHNDTEYVMAPQANMMSGRVLQLFLEEKVRGLRPYMPDPDLKYGVVDIR